MKEKALIKVKCLLIVLSLLIILDYVATAENTIIRVNVGMIVDQKNWVGKMGLRCINMALSDFYSSAPNYKKLKTKLFLHTRNYSNSDVVQTASSALDLIKNEEVMAIIGPKTSTETSFVIEIGNKAQVPIISYSASSPSLLQNTRSSYFFQATQSDNLQIKVIASIFEAFEWKQVVPIYVGDAFGEPLIPFLTNAFQQIDVLVPYRSRIPPFATDDQILKELYHLMTMQTRVFIVHMDADLGSRIFSMAKKIGMMKQGYAWIVTTGITNSLSFIDSSEIYSMQGVLGIKTYVPKTNGLQIFKARWKIGQSKQDNSTINVHGLWAYDAAKALAMAVEEVIGKNGNLGFNKAKNVSGNSTTDLETFGLSKNGPKLREALSNVMFNGLAGNFNLKNGNLHASTFQIINVINNEEKVIGFWNKENGLVRNLNSVNRIKTNKYSKSHSCKGLKPIIWPGESNFVPKGWEIPTQGKKLKIGVPMKHGQEEYVKVTRDPHNNITSATGFCIDVFDAVMKALPYYVAYDFVAFPDSYEKTLDYDELVDQVYLGKFDAVVGDITIRKDRSKHVDFTLPYIESGVTMIVPVKDRRSKNAWVFLVPLTWDLWATTACFFIFIGFVVWVLEHRINDDFRGPPSYQIGTSFWFSFSTMVFAHKERVVSNLARFVVIIWAFVVLILTQSYTASLTSLLTVQQLQPTVTDVNQLLKNRENVGYLEGSFVRGMLKDKLGFQDSQLKNYSNPDDLENLFSLREEDGGIAAAFDESPYTKIFLEKYCSKYAMVDPNFKTAGFGFVFPKGSSLVPDVSRAILEVTEEDNIKNIENKWFMKNKTSCPGTNTQVSSNSLGLESFWGLFLIAGVASLFALTVYVVIFIHEQRHVFHSTNPETSIWERFGAVLKILDQKDSSSHNFRNNTEQHNERRGTNQIIVNGVETVPDTTENTRRCQPSPTTTCSNDTERVLSFSTEQEAISVLDGGNFDPTPSAIDVSDSLEFEVTQDNGNNLRGFLDN